MPPTIGGGSMPLESGQSGNARAAPGGGTIPPAKIRNKVRTATTFVKSRSQSGTGRTGVIRGFYTSTSCQNRGLCLHPLDELIMRIDGELPAHPVMAVAAELRAGDLPRRAFVGPDRREMDRHFHPRDGVLLHAHHREGEAVDDVLRRDVDDDRAFELHVELVDHHDVVLP